MTSEPAATSEPPAVTGVDPAEARRLVSAGACLLDVREDDEWDAGHATEAMHVPMGALAERIDRVPDDRTVVCICRVGSRSGAVATALAGAGFDVRNVEGGMLAWQAAGLPVVTGAGATGQVV